MIQNTKYIIGVDEVGRGPIAGPITVCAVMVRQNPKSKYQISKVFRGIKDSKKLSEKQREDWFERLKDARARGLLDWRISFVTAAVIDREGISHAARMCVRRALSRLECEPEKTSVLLDGGLFAPSVFVNQKTIIRGDEKENLIAAASIVAKVSRDRRMRNYAVRFPKYGFDQHKGYGTKSHMRATKSHGMCALHRKTFLSRL